MVSLPQKSVTQAESLAGWEKEKLNPLFYRYSKLKRAWVLKESFSA
jgi:hypothetical protein